MVLTGAVPMCRNGLTHRLDRGLRTGQMCGGSSRNLGGLVRSMPSENGMGYHKKSLACGRERSPVRRSEQKMNAGDKWYCAREGDETRRDGGETS